MPVKNSSIISNFSFIKEIKRRKKLWSTFLVIKSLLFNFAIALVSMHGGLISEIENCQTIFRTYARTTFFQHSLHFCFVSEAKNFTWIQENVPVENCEIVSKTAFRTWGLPHLRGVHFSRNSYSVAPKALFTIRVVIR